MLQTRQHDRDQVRPSEGLASVETHHDRSPKGFLCAIALTATVMFRLWFENELDPKATSIGLLALQPQQTGSQALKRKCKTSPSLTS